MNSDNLASSNNLFDIAYQCILEKDPTIKSVKVNQLYTQFHENNVSISVNEPVQSIENPGRPARPSLVPPSDVPRRGFNSKLARIKLAHAIAHIEFNAINLALDAVYRFQDMPNKYYSDWLQVAVEEAKHFSLLNQYLKNNHHQYGDFASHNGLWEMALKTDSNVMIRMALVPRVLEARGLDVTPGMIKKLNTVNDNELVEILEVIHREEIGHVRIGTYWFNYVCELENKNPELTFSELLDEYMQDSSFGPFDLGSRQKAGFTKNEMKDLMLRTKN